METAKTASLIFGIAFFIAAICSAYVGTNPWLCGTLSFVSILIAAIIDDCEDKKDGYNSDRDFWS